MARTEIRIGRYSIDLIPVVFLVLTAVLCNQLNSSENKSGDAIKLLSDVNRQRTAAEMRALNAERELAKSSMQNAPNVVVITPDGKPVHSADRKEEYSAVQREVSF